MQTLEVGHLRLVTGLDQHLVAGLDKGACASTKDGLLAEQVGLGFLLEGSLDDSGARPADALGPSEGDLLGLTIGVLLDGDQARHALALDVLATDDVPGALRRDQNHVNVLRRHDRLEVHREPVGEEQRFALGQVRLDVVLEYVRLAGVRHGHEDYVGAFHRLGVLVNLESLALGHLG